MKNKLYKIIKDNKKLKTLQDYKKLDKKQKMLLNKPLSKLSEREVIIIDKRTDNLNKKITPLYKSLMNVLTDNGVSKKEANSYLLSFSKIK